MSAKILAPLCLIVSCVCGIEIISDFKSLNKSGACYGDIQHLVRNGSFSDMVNTWSNFSRDYVYGASFDFGDFKSCMAFNHRTIRAQHCFVQYQYRPSSNHTVIPVLPKVSMGNFDLKNIHERFGGAICVPDSCTADDVRNVMRDVFEKSDFMQSDDYDQSKYCQHKNHRFTFDTLRVVSITCMSLISLLVVTGTLLTNSSSSSTVVKYLQCFSARRNFKTLTDLSTTKSTITCINGIKAISTIGIFFFHSFLIKISYPYRDGKDFQALVASSMTYTIASFTIVIDTFLVVSGILVGRTLIKSENFSFVKFCIQRYMRLTLLTLVLICYITLTYSLFKLQPKPYVHLDFTLIDDCKEHWWTTALNVQTFVNPKHMCVVQSWFASVLFHLIVFAALLHVIVRDMSRTKVFVSHAMILVYGLILRLLVFTRRETFFDAQLASVMDMSNDILEDTYYTIYTRVMPFFSGVLLAHVFDRSIAFAPLKSEKVNRFIIGIAFYLSITFIVLFPFMLTPEKYLAILLGIVYIVAINFVIYACHTGHGGFINDFLSLKLWIPLSKMSLSIYLVSLCHQGTLTFTRTTPYDVVTFNDIIFGFFFDAALAAVPTLLIYTTVECSITNLANLVTGKENRSCEKN